MKKLFVLLLALGTFTAYAGPKASCEVVNGTYDNSILRLRAPVVIDSFGQEGFDKFSLMKVETLTLNLFGREDVFALKGTSVSGGTKLDFSLESSQEQVRAVLLTDKTPGRTKNSFKALLVITGAGINLSVDDTSLYSASSLVYNLKCKNL